MTPKLTPESPETGPSGVRATMVTTLQNGVQIRAGVKNVTYDGKLKARQLLAAVVTNDPEKVALDLLHWEPDDDPYGNVILFLDRKEVVAIHFEYASAAHGSSGGSRSRT